MVLDAANTDPALAAAAPEAAELPSVIQKTEDVTFPAPAADDAAPVAPAAIANEPLPESRDAGAATPCESIADYANELAPSGSLSVEPTQSEGGGEALVDAPSAEVTEEEGREEPPADDVVEKEEAPAAEAEAEPVNQPPSAEEPATPAVEEATPAPDAEPTEEDAFEPAEPAVEEAAPAEEAVVSIEPSRSNESHGSVEVSLGETKPDAVVEEAAAPAEATPINAKEDDEPVAEEEEEAPLEEAKPKEVKEEAKTAKTRSFALPKVKIPVSPLRKPKFSLKKQAKKEPEKEAAKEAEAPPAPEEVVEEQPEAEPQAAEEVREESEAVAEEGPVAKEESKDASEEEELSEKLETIDLNEPVEPAVAETVEEKVQEEPTSEEAVEETEASTEAATSEEVPEVAASSEKAVSFEVAPVEEQPASDEGVEVPATLFERALAKAEGCFGDLTNVCGTWTKNDDELEPQLSKEEAAELQAIERKQTAEATAAALGAEMKVDADDDTPTSPFDAVLSPLSVATEHAASFAESLGQKLSDGYDGAAKSAEEAVFPQQEREQETDTTKSEAEENEPSGPAVAQAESAPKESAETPNDEVEEKSEKPASKKALSARLNKNKASLKTLAKGVSSKALAKSKDMKKVTKRWTLKKPVAGISKRSKRSQSSEANASPEVVQDIIVGEAPAVKADADVEPSSPVPQEGEKTPEEASAKEPTKEEADSKVTPEADEAKPESESEAEKSEDP